MEFTRTSTCKEDVKQYFSELTSEWEIKIKDLTINAMMGGKLHVGAYAQRIGATGLTFLDDDVTEFFTLDAAGKSVMFLIALGRSAKQNRVEPDGI